MHMKYVSRQKSLSNFWERKYKNVFNNIIIIIQKRDQLMFKSTFHPTGKPNKN